MSKNIAWSYSKLKGFEDCPKRFYETQIAKNYIESTEELDAGKVIHKAMEDAVTRKKKLPIRLQRYQKWVDFVHAIQDGSEGDLLVEEKYAVKKGAHGELLPTDWKDWDHAWFRGVADIVVLAANAIAIDWKTGKPRNVDEVQLALMAQCIFVHYPSVQVVQAMFVYLPSDTHVPIEVTRDQLRDEIWPDLAERVDRYVEAVRTQTFPPKPGFLCARYCPVASCVHHGKKIR